MAILAAFAVPHPPLIIPAVGRGREHDIQSTVDAYDEVGRRIAQLAPETIVVSTPHSVMYRDYNHISPGTGAHGSFADCGASQARYDVTYDAAFATALAHACEHEDIAAGTDYERNRALDHATMIPVHFIQRHWSQDVPAPRYVRIGLSGLPITTHYALGREIQRTAAKLGRRMVYVASGDLSHKLLADGPYGFDPDGPVFDEKICAAFTSADFLQLLSLDPTLCDNAAECGWRSFAMMAGALDATLVAGELLSYEGPFGVGYGVAAFSPVGPEGSDASRAYLEPLRAEKDARISQIRAGEDPYVRLARLSLETRVREGHRLSLRSPLIAETFPEGLPADMTGRRAGCFVSLKIDGDLRGCIGTIAATASDLAEEIVQNAVSAGLHDPRFPPVKARELEDIVYDVDVLGETEPVSSYDELDPVRYGVIVSTSDGRRGLLLPNLDGVDTVEQQVSIAARKGGISLADEPVTLQRFEVVRHL